LVSEHLTDRRAVVELHVLLLRMDDVSRQSHADRSNWLEELGNWLHDGGAIFGASDEERTAKLRVFVLSLGSVRGFRENFASLFTSLVSELRGTKLFADVGIPIEPAFWREAVDRFARRVLPAPPAPRSFADFARRLFPTEAEARWLERSPPELWLRLWTLLEGTKAPLSTAWLPLAGSMADATRILAARVAALGVAQDIRDRLPEIRVSDLPFLHLTRVCEAVQLGPPRKSTSNEAALQTIEQCRATLAQVHSHVEEFGVSVDLVYRLELMTAQLARLEQLVVLLVPRSFEALPYDLGRFTLGIVRAQFQGRSLVALLHASSHLLARKVVERTGRSGEHYITTNRPEWRSMLFSAAGGGILTAFTAAFKFLTGGLGLGIVLGSVVSSVNYAGSFVAMGALGFTLATKQPSMTAAALAASLGAGAGSARTKSGDDSLSAMRRSRLSDPTITDDPDTIERLVTLTTQISRSQLAAAMGNVFLVIPTAIVFDIVWRRVFGAPLLGAAKAEHVIHSLSPIHSGTIPFAALTGVLLWLSSLGAGWFENWVTYRRLPEALASHRRLKRLFGPRRALKIAKSLEHGAASFGGSIALGALLGITPAIGLELGLPIDVRHVTLSTGSLVFSASTLGAGVVATREYLEAIAGILIIGSLNFGVSFVLALAVALRARDAWRVGSIPLLMMFVRGLVRRFVRRPMEFVFPPAPASRREASPSE
jgi:site-specific recombinase